MLFWKLHTEIRGRLAFSSLRVLAVLVKEMCLFLFCFVDLVEKHDENLTVNLGHNFSCLQKLLDNRFPTVIGSPYLLLYYTI